MTLTRLHIPFLLRNVDSVDENGKSSYSSISSNVRDARLVPFSVTESLNGYQYRFHNQNTLMLKAPFTPSSSDGSASITVTMKTDSIYYNNNSFSLSIPTIQNLLI